jgi:spore maturation protein CgeB
MTFQRFLVVSGTPDEVNSNAALRDYVVDGFREAFPDASALGVPYAMADIAITQWKPQCVIVFGSVMLDSTDFVPVAQAVEAIGALLVFWLHDDPYEFDMNERVFPFAKAVFTNDLASLDHYPSTLPVFHLPLGVSPLAHARKVQQRSSPGLFFCGQSFGNRERFFRSIVRRAGSRGSTIQIYGNGWNTAELPQALNQRLPNSVLPDYYASAVAVANIGRSFNLSNRRYAIKPSTPGPRTFEAAGAGAAQIALTDGLEITDYFEPDREFLLAQDEDEFFEHWTRLLADPEYSMRLGAAAQCRALAEHTYAARAKSLLGSLETI